MDFKPEEAVWKRFYETQQIKQSDSIKMEPVQLDDVVALTYEVGEPSISGYQEATLRFSGSKAQIDKIIKNLRLL
jgi:hypothetical protein